MEKLGNTKSETQEELNKILGFDYDTFTSTACFEQGEADVFSKLDPSEAKKVVMKILQLGEFETYEKKCREIYNKLYEEGIKIKQEVDTLNSLVDFKIVDITPFETRLVVVEKEMKEFETVIEGYRQLDEKYTAATALFNECKSKLERINKMEKCSYCLQTVNETHKEIIRKEFEKDLVKLTEAMKNNSVKDSLQKAVGEYNIRNTEGVGLSNQISELKRKNEATLKVQKNKDTLEKRLEEIKKDLEAYKKLVTAFGKDGIPSYIIENAIPEIEAIVNDLLNALEVDMMVSLNMQRDLKGGGTSDTLDIVITANGAPGRMYYNYSGGEKFIIDLALRLALSIILLRRKGCNNSTLIIDEGFGSLDNENNDKVLKLIGLVKEKFGFKRILVITHVQDIKENLDKKIVVVKTDNQSELRYG